MSYASDQLRDLTRAVEHKLEVVFSTEPLYLGRVDYGTQRITKSFDPATPTPFGNGTAYAEAITSALESALVDLTTPTPFAFTVGQVVVTQEGGICIHIFYDSALVDLPTFA